MKVNCHKILRNLSFFSVLILFTFSLLSFTPTNKTLNNFENNLEMEKQIKVVITKTTTLDELEKIKKQVIDQGLGFNFSDVVYNAKNEIIAITIQFKDANNNSGNYSVSGEKPINNIVIVSDGGRISVKSEGSSNQAFISQGGGSNNSSIAQKSYEDQRLEMKDKRDQMEKEMEERMQEMKARHAAMETRMLKRRDSMLSQSQARGSHDFIRDSNLITKNTTDQELLEIQKSYEADNIVFNYQNLQRNDKDEITHISITIDNQNGSLSTSGFGNGREAIKDITVAVDAHHTIMKSAE